MTKHTQATGHTESNDRCSSNRLEINEIIENRYFIWISTSYLVY